MLIAGDSGCRACPACYQHLRRIPLAGAAGHRCHVSGGTARSTMPKWSIRPQWSGLAYRSSTATLSIALNGGRAHWTWQSSRPSDDDGPHCSRSTAERSREWNKGPRVRIGRREIRVQPREHVSEVPARLPEAGESGRAQRVVIHDICQRPFRQDVCEQPTGSRLEKSGEAGDVERCWAAFHLAAQLRH
jgi:hypothetical protein